MHIPVVHRQQALLGHAARRSYHSLPTAHVGLPAWQASMCNNHMLCAAHGLASSTPTHSVAN
jgi:hypothetical protein